MGQARCNARRRRQARSNNAHVSGMGIPHYRKPDMATSAARSAEVVRREKERAQRKGMSNKK
jgi:hypothetical protein